MVSSGKFLPARASEESAGKVPKAGTYLGGSVGVDVGVRYCHCAARDEHPATLPKTEVLTFGQFREVSSAGGVGRKCQEGSKGKRIRRWHCWSRCWCLLLSLCHHRRCTSPHPAKQGTCLRSVSSGKFLPPGASEESAWKVSKASAYAAAGTVGVDVGARYCYCGET